MDIKICELLEKIEPNKAYVEIVQSFVNFNFCLHNPLQNYLYQSIILQQAKCVEENIISQIYEIKKQQFKSLCCLIIKLGASATVLHNLFVNKRNLSLDIVDNNTSITSLVLSNLAQETTVLNNMCHLVNKEQPGDVESVFECLVKQQENIIEMLQNMCEEEQVDNINDLETNYLEE